MPLVVFGHFYLSATSCLLAVSCHIVSFCSSDELNFHTELFFWQSDNFLGFLDDLAFCPVCPSSLSFAKAFRGLFSSISLLASGSFKAAIFRSNEWLFSP